MSRMKEMPLPCLGFCFFRRLTVWVAALFIPMMGGCATGGIWGAWEGTALGGSPITHLDTRDRDVPQLVGVCRIDARHLGLALTAPKKHGQKIALGSIEIPSFSKMNRVSKQCTNLPVQLTAYGQNHSDKPTDRVLSLGPWKKQEGTLLLSDSTPSHWSDLLTPGMQPQWILIGEGQEIMNIPQDMELVDGIRQIRIWVASNTEDWNGPKTYAARILVTPLAVAADVITLPFQIVLLIGMAGNSPKG